MKEILILNEKENYEMIDFIDYSLVFKEIYNEYTDNIEYEVIKNEANKLNLEYIDEEELLSYVRDLLNAWIRKEILK